MCIGFVYKLKRNKSLAQSFNGSAKLQMVIKGSAKVFCFNPKVVLTEKSYASKIYYYQPKKKTVEKTCQIITKPSNTIIQREK